MKILLKVGVSLAGNHASGGQYFLAMSEDEKKLRRHARNFAKKAMCTLVWHKGGNGMMIGDVKTPKLKALVCQMVITDVEPL